jgi:hypothetical protein
LVIDIDTVHTFPWVWLDSFTVMDPIPPVRLDSLGALEGKVLFQVLRTKCRLPCTPRYYLSMYTQHIYGCSNFEIKADLRATRRLLEVAVEGIHAPDICLTALGPATAHFDLPLRRGAYRLHFIHRGARDRYVVQVSDRGVRIVTLTSEFTALAPRRGRVPRMP